MARLSRCRAARSATRGRRPAPGRTRRTIELQLELFTFECFKLECFRLELVKFVSDIGKAIYDCELSFAHEGVFIGCALFSALLSTHKNMVKVLK